MEHLTASQRPKFLIFGFIFLIVWLSSAAIFWHYFVEKMPLAKIGYDKIALVAIGAVIMTGMMLKNKFLRPRFKKQSPAIRLWQLSVWVAALILTMLFGSLLMHFFLMKGPIIMVFNELVTFVCLGIYIILAETIIIPAVKTAHK
ncbi:MAG: hypothetical protein PHE24_06220 [Patescibacteria group bacterium]|nr:hypothetical protein [Patescibacteria group bacterium]